MRLVVSYLRAKFWGSTPNFVQASVWISLRDLVGGALTAALRPLYMTTTVAEDILDASYEVFPMVVCG